MFCVQTHGLCSGLCVSIVLFSSLLGACSFCIASSKICVLFTVCVWVQICISERLLFQINVLLNFVNQRITVSSTNRVTSQYYCFYCCLSNYWCLVKNVSFKNNIHMFNSKTYTAYILYISELLVLYISVDVYRFFFLSISLEWKTDEHWLEAKCLM